MRLEFSTGVSGQLAVGERSKFLLLASSRI